MSNKNIMLRNALRHKAKSLPQGSYSLLQNQIKVFETDSGYLSKKINQIASNASSKKRLNKIKKIVDRKRSQTQPNTLDLIKLHNSVEIFNSKVQDVGDLNNFNDEIRDLEYVKKLDQNRKEAEKDYRNRMRRISFEYNAERSPEKNQFEAKQIMKDIKQIHEEFNKIIAPKEVEIQGNKAKALLEKKNILDGIEKDKIGKNIGH